MDLEDNQSPSEERGFGNRNQNMGVKYFFISFQINLQGKNTKPFVNSRVQNPFANNASSTFGFPQKVY